MYDYLDILSDFAVALQFNDLPESVIEQTKKYIADYYAASCAGFRVNKTFNEAVIEVVRSFGGYEQSTILFEKRKFTVEEAAFVNAVYAHGADMDDGNKNAAGHIGTHVIPAVFSVAEWRNRLWRDVVVAINVGYEFFNRIASAAQPSLYQKGFHSTGIVGAIACAAASAKILTLGKDKIYDAVSIAAVQSSGLIIIDESGQGCKPINPGNAARIGVFSALLAMHGIKSPRNTLQSAKGWFRAYSGNQYQKVDVQDLGKNFTIMESYLKLYPSCRHTHSCIDAALKLRNEIVSTLSMGIADIDCVDIFTYPSAIRSAGAIYHPNNTDEAKFSIPYAVAVALWKGNFELSDLMIKGEPPQVSKLSDSIVLRPDESLENRERGIRGCRMVIHMNNGICLERTIETPKGEGEFSLNWDDIRKKMLSCSEGVLEETKALSIIEKCQMIDVDKQFEILLV